MKKEDRESKSTELVKHSILQTEFFNVLNSLLN